MLAGNRMQTISLNARFYAHRPTGMQRYCLELVERLGSRLNIIRPPCALRGSLGHLWEQTYLPLAASKDLLWSPNNTGPVTMRRQVCTIHDVLPLDHPEWFGPRFVALYRWLLPRLVERVQHIIAISEFTKTRIVERFRIDPAKVSVVPNGVNLDWACSQEDHAGGIRKKFGMNGHSYVLCVGALGPRKNLARLLTAWSRLTKEFKDHFRLVVVGEKGRTAVFGEVTLGEMPPGVILTGYVSQQELAALYSGATAFVYPSLYEGFGLPPLEAMACGVPVITSATTSIPEVMGDAGILIDPCDVDAITDALNRVLGSECLRQDLTQRGRKRAESFRWESTAQSTWRVLESAASV